MADDALQSEVAELRQLLAAAKAPGNVRDLTQLLARKQQALETAAAAAAALKAQEAPAAVHETSKQPPVVVPVRSSDVDDVTPYVEISRFGWEDDGYGKDKVAVYVMSGIDGVGDLPKESVTCSFTKSSLVKNHLEKNIVPAKSSFRVKKNRVTVTLWKADKNHSWLNLTEKNPGKAPRSDSSDPAAGIMDMMKNMYDEGDDEMKRTIAKAWSESREKNATPGF
ncbi:hypothetical protein PybrP1_002335 [[Pythium] brassicae (nom. inval.)]|nr:hypothetical protein PybrP1_002335 [[Pythium] brassicae (nom. inval.)]